MKTGVLYYFKLESGSEGIAEFSEFKTEKWIIQKGFIKRHDRFNYTDSDRQKYHLLVSEIEEFRPATEQEIQDWHTEYALTLL